MAYRYFISTAWGGTGTPASLPPVYDDDGNLIAEYCYTFDQAYNNAVAGDHVCPAPPNTPGCAFLDAFGKPLKTVVVQLGGDLTINKAITLSGGAYRLRLDGNGTRFCNFAPDDAVYCADVDFVNFALSWRYFVSGKNFRFTRCIVSGVNGSNFSHRYAGFAFNEFLDCVLHNVSGGCDWTTFKRCSIYGSLTSVATSNTVIDSTGDAFVDAANGDLHLAPNSAYATGNTLTSASGVVYDLDGNKRKIGGARGAYEVLSEVTRTAQAQEPGYCYTVTKGNANAPDVDSIALYDVGGRNTLLCAGKYSGASKISFSEDDVTYTTARNVAADGYDSRAKSNSNVFMKLTNANDDETIVRFYAPDDTAPSDAIPCAADFNHPKTWAEDAAPSSSDVCYIGTNDNFVSSSGGGVSKIIVPGWTRPNLGNVPAVDPEIGVNAVVTTRGAITLTNRTSTSAEVLAPFDPQSGAAFTFQNCAVSDAASA